MSLDDLREIGDAFGTVLQDSLDDLGKMAEVRGGGLRHGDIEWQVSYSYEGLRRVLLFDLAEATGALITISSQAIATDDSGNWASTVAGSTSLPRRIMLEQLLELVQQILNQARFVANSLESRDMRPMIVGSLGDTSS